MQVTLPPKRRTVRTAAAVVAVFALALGLASCDTRTRGASVSTAPSSATASGPTSSSPSESSSATVSASPTPTVTVPPTGSGAPVHIKLFGGDGQVYGIAMPIMAYFSRKITNATGFLEATTVKLNGQPAAGAWYFEDSALIPGYPIEAHYRLAHYWPGNASITMTMNTKGISGGAGLVYDDSLTLAWQTGRTDLLRVDGNTHRLTVYSDGKVYGIFPVSLGAPNTPTLLGTKVIMEKDRNERMVGPGYDEIVPWSLRLTNSGEFLHAAPWNVGNIGYRNTSNGCTNLIPATAQRLFSYLQIGDPVTYTNVAGKVQPVWDGYGDWNVPWSSWLTGGVVSTHIA